MTRPKKRAQRSAPAKGGKRVRHHLDVWDVVLEGSEDDVNDVRGLLLLGNHAMSMMGIYDAWKANAQARGKHDE